MTENAETKIPHLSTVALGELNPESWVIIIDDYENEFEEDLKLNFLESMLEFAQEIGLEKPLATWKDDLHCPVESCAFLLGEEEAALMGKRAGYRMEAAFHKEVENKLDAGEKAQVKFGEGIVVNRKTVAELAETQSFLPEFKSDANLDGNDI